MSSASRTRRRRPGGKTRTPRRTCRRRTDRSRASSPPPSTPPTGVRGLPPAAIVKRDSGRGPAQASHEAAGTPVARIDIAVREGQCPIALRLSIDEPSLVPAAIRPDRDADPVLDALAPLAPVAGAL